MADVRRLRARRVENDFAALLAAARAGDPAGFEGLFRLLDRRLHAFTRVRRAADPEGVVNEVFLQVFRKLDSFDGDEAAFTGWVFTIARNKLIDEARRADRRPDEILDEDATAMRRAGGDAEQDALQRMASGEALEMLETLTPDQRDVLLLRVVADLSIGATAVALGKPEGAVKALQRRAVAALARKNSSDPYPEADPVRSW